MKKYLLLAFLLIPVLVFCQNMYVVNSISQTLGKYNLSNGENYPSFSNLGQGPNSMPNRMALTDNSIYVVLSGENSVQVIDKQTGLTQTRIYLEDSANPYDIVIDGNYAYVTGLMTYKVYKINLGTHIVEASVNVGIAPEYMIIAETDNGRKLFVSNSGLDSLYNYHQGTLSVIDLNDFSSAASVDVGLNPQGMTLHNDKIYVACTGNYADVTGQIDVVDINLSQVVFSLNLSGTPGSVVYDERTEKLFIGNAWPCGVYVVDTRTMSVEVAPEEGIFVGGSALWLTDSNLLTVDPADYVTSSVVRIYSVDDYSLIDTITVGVGTTDVKYENMTAANNQVAAAFASRAYPNPSSSMVRFSSLVRGKVKLEVFNLKGQKVYSEISVNPIFKGKDSKGRICAGGVYFYRLAAKEGVSTGKFLYLK